MPEPTKEENGLSNNRWVVGVIVFAAVIGILAALVAIVAGFFALPKTVLSVQSPPELRTPAPSPSMSQSTGIVAPPATLALIRSWIGDRAANSPNLTDIGIAVVGDRDAWSASAAGEVEKAIADQRASVRLVHMTEAFVTEGAFGSLFSGDRSPLERVDLSRYVDWILLIRMSSECGSSPEYRNIRTCRASAEGRYVSARSGALARTTGGNATGAGRTVAEAEVQSWERIGEAVAADAP